MIIHLHFKFSTVLQFVLDKLSFLAEPNRFRQIALIIKKNNTTTSVPVISLPKQTLLVLSMFSYCHVYPR
jgi:hypothetical protein